MKQPVSGPTAKTLATGQVSVGTSATQLSATSVKLINGLRVKNLSTSAGSVFIGVSGVTTSTGYELAPGESERFDIDDVDTLYAIAGSSGYKVCYQGN